MREATFRRSGHDEGRDGRRARGRQERQLAPADSRTGTVLMSKSQPDTWSAGERPPASRPCNYCGETVVWVQGHKKWQFRNAPPRQEVWELGIGGAALQDASDADLIDVRGTAIHNCPKDPRQSGRVRKSQATPEQLARIRAGTWRPGQD